MWSKLRRRFESLFAECFRGRLSAHVTEYTRTNQLDVGRAWLTLDGKELVSVQIPSFYSDSFNFRTETLDFGKAVYEYVSLPIDEAKASSDELVAAFVHLDRRFGKRSLREVDPCLLHPFARQLFQARCEAEGLREGRIEWRPTTGSRRTAGADAQPKVVLRYLLTT